MHDAAAANPLISRCTAGPRDGAVSAQQTQYTRHDHDTPKKMRAPGSQTANRDRSGKFKIHSGNLLAGWELQKPNPRRRDPRRGAGRAGGGGSARSCSTTLARLPASAFPALTRGRIDSCHCGKPGVGPRCGGGRAMRRRGPRPRRCSTCLYARRFRYAATCAFSFVLGT